MKKFIIPILSGLSVLLAGCPSNRMMESKFVDQDAIYQKHSVSYEEEGDLTGIVSEFHVDGVNGTTLVLTEPSDVRCEDGELRAGTYLLGGAYYYHSFNGYLPVVTVEFIDYQKKSYVNRLPLPAARFTEQTVKPGLHRTITVAFDGPPCAKGESLQLRIDGDSLSASVDAVPGGTFFSVTPADLQKFKPAERLTLQIIRKNNGPLREATIRGGDYYTAYYSKKITTVLE